MTKAAGDQLVCGLINGMLCLIDTGKLQVLRVIEKAHTGTVVACKALKSSNLEIVVSQDDSREIKVWNAKDMN